jgi:AcrR family transcriptional regulator
MRIRRRSEAAGPEADGTESDGPESDGPESAGPGPGGSQPGDGTGGPPGGGCAGHRLRADAARNRDAIIAMARDVFAEQGLGAPLEEIAARAGVGIGTLYRRFPTRRDLIAAALHGKVSQYAQAGEQALATSDSWAGFTAFIQRTCELQAADRGLAELLALPAAAVPAAAGETVDRLRQLASEHAGAVIERAKAAGKLRADFSVADLALLLIAAGAVMAASGTNDPCAWQRFVVLAMEGVQAPGDGG